MKHRAYLIILFVLLPATVLAQNMLKRIATRADTMLHRLYRQVDYDTSYIERSEGTMGVKVWGNVSGLNYRALGNGVQAHLKTDEKATMSIEFDFYDLAMEIALNPASLSGRNKDFELNMNFYSRRYSLEACYQIAKTLRGDMTAHGQEAYIEKGWMSTKMLNISAHYTFNYRYFSYDAPFYQLYRQKLSAGSWLAGFSYQGGSVKTTGEIPAGVPEARIYIGHFAIGGGYAYNWVPGNHWLLHISAIPNVIVCTGDNITVNGERQYGHTTFPALLLNERIAVVYYFNGRHFIGLNGVACNLLKRNSGTTMRQSKWLVRAFYGIRL